MLFHVSLFSIYISYLTLAVNEQDNHITDDHFVTNQVEFSNTYRNPIVSHTLRFLLQYAVGKALDAIISEVSVLLIEDYKTAETLPIHERYMTIEALNELEIKINLLEQKIQSNEISFRNELIKYIDDNIRPLEQRFIFIENRLSALENSVADLEVRVTALEFPEVKKKESIFSGKINFYPSIFFNFNYTNVNKEFISQLINTNNSNNDGPLGSYDGFGVGINSFIGRLFSFNTAISYMHGSQEIRSVYDLNSTQYQSARLAGRSKIEYIGFSINSDINLLLLLPSRIDDAHPTDGIYLELGGGYSLNTFDIRENDNSNTNRNTIDNFVYGKPYLNTGIGLNFDRIGFLFTRKIFIETGEIDYLASINSFSLRIYLP